MLGSLWQNFWRRAPRQIKFSRSGKIITAVALVVGFAAINTGNNLLYLGWSLVLSAIVLSGVLSETNIRKVQLRLRPPTFARAGQEGSLVLEIYNTYRFLALFGLEALISVEAKTQEVLNTPYHLRLGPKAEEKVNALHAPAHRGLHRIERLAVKTTYPFGFFIKTRRLKIKPIEFWVAPRKLDVQEDMDTLLSWLGSETLGQIGHGPDFFALRPYHEGDDPRHIAWKRSARTGRLVVREHEAVASRSVELVLVLSGQDSDADEYTIAYAGSLAESLLLKGVRVGLLGPGVSLKPGVGSRQIQQILYVLARLNMDAAMTPVHGAPGVSRMALCSPGQRAPEAMDHVLHPRSMEQAA
ncbi:MAG: DUF58 domain-containing protein [Myxococcota bacterium]|jgi:uncharacterized protein (DUF58 family)|nr:DUF58 domain-containing protein [Myxococcota bacterium]